jgi:hypothetical protein
MQAKLISPKADKGWSLQFFEVSDDPIVRANIWYWSRHYGEHFGVAPFKQGDFDDWIMIEFWRPYQSLILEACLMICKQLDVELEL